MKDLTGQRFGRLVAIRSTEKRRSSSVVWECICDCGNTAFISRDALNSGGTRSCGCLRRNPARSMLRQKHASEGAEALQQGPREETKD